MQDTIDQLEKLEKVAELKANLLLRLVPNLSEYDQRQVLLHEIIFNRVSMVQGGIPTPKLPGCEAF